MKRCSSISPARRLMKREGRPANSGTCARASRGRTVTERSPSNGSEAAYPGVEPLSKAVSVGPASVRRVGVPLDRSEGGMTRRLPHGAVITRQGAAVSSLYLVTAGAVRLSAVTASGREVVVGLLSRGDLFGEAALLGGPSQVRAQAVGSTCVLAMPVASLRSLLGNHPATAEQLLRLIASRLHRTSVALEDALTADVPGRVAGRLRELAAHHGEPGPAGVRLRVPLTQDELARMVGASRESVNRTVGALSARGVLRSRGGRVTIADPAALDAPG